MRSFQEYPKYFIPEILLIAMLVFIFFACP
jgi:hypothetical protein